MVVIECRWREQWKKELAAHIHGWKFAGFSVKFCDETGDKDVR